MAATHGGAGRSRLEPDPVRGTPSLKSCGFPAKSRFDTKLKQFSNFVRAAADNTDDRPTRELRTRQFEEYSFDAIRALEDLSLRAPGLTAEYQSWLKRWVTQTIRKIDINTSDFNFYTEQLKFGVVYGVFAEAKDLSMMQRGKANDLLKLL